MQGTFYEFGEKEVKTQKKKKRALSGINTSN
jgi:hypothetical protein